MTEFSQHGEWLSLIDVSGPFLAEPVLKQAFPQGLEQTDPLKRRHARQAYDEWREAVNDDDPEVDAIHRAWIDLVLKQVLELDEDGEADVLKPAGVLSDSLSVSVPEHDVSVRPNYAVVDDQNEDQPLLLVQAYPPDTALDASAKGDRWAASPAERMIELCRACDVRLGLVTNGERWMLIDAPVGGVTTFASWYARLWGQEPITLQAFVNLLGIRRFFVDKSEQLPALFDESLKLQDEVTDALGEQVRRAVEVLIQALDRADVDRNRKLLTSVEPPELYEAALTVMMRIVFLLSAEERGLLLLDDEGYQSNYAVSTLRMQLRAESEEILERRQDAWSRLLSIFRAVYGGIEHEALKLPALGGSLFDPDRFPFLEGRAKATNWKTHPAAPLPIDNRTVLLLLDAVQLFRGRTLSYRALDIEQIGYVYEGLLERTVVRAREVTLDLNATKNAKKPWVTLDELETAADQGENTVEALLRDRTGSSASRITNDLAKKIDDAAADRLLTACHGDQGLRDRIKPYLHFLGIDRWGYPLVYPQSTFMVTSGADRRETGTHYTPKSLTEAIVKETLEPLVYIGPAEGRPREDWALKSSAELLDLKICDPAMGSGAFLVQACRWLSERLVEAWRGAEAAGQAITSGGEVVGDIGALEPLRDNAEDRMLTARRLIAERCLYGVDMNPLAVELAKLSIWLITLAKGRPFGFLDHNLRYGDSLLGIHDLDQLLYLNMVSGKSSSKKLFAAKIDTAVERALELRAKLRSRPIRDICDVEFMASLDERARQELQVPQLIADAFIGEVLLAGGGEPDTIALSIEAGKTIDDPDASAVTLLRRARSRLRADVSEGRPPRRPFHWPLEFPEVFRRENSGFDAIIGNPPFLGGQRISGTFGSSYKDYLAHRLTLGDVATADLVVFFFLRVYGLIREKGYLGLLARRSFAEGKNREVGLEQLIDQGAVIFAAYTNILWPGKASVIVHQVHTAKSEWSGAIRLNGKPVTSINAYLDDLALAAPKRLVQNSGRMFQGVILNNEGFKIGDKEARALLDIDQKYRTVVFPFIGGNEVNSNPDNRPACWVINFWDWPEAKAQQYSAAYRRIESASVSPDGNSARVRKKNWWRFLRPRPDLHHAIGRGSDFVKHPKGWRGDTREFERVIVISRGVTKYPAFTFLSNHFVFSEKLYVIADDRYSLFSVLSSDIHAVWAWTQKTSMGADLHSLSYTNGDIFETFPFPENVLEHGDEELENLGGKFFDERQRYMESTGRGVTKLYNDFHDPAVNDDAIVGLRRMQNEINQIVCRRYGWTDFDLDCGFHEVGYLPEGKNIRFTISESARLEVLRRLVGLNRQRWEEEQASESQRSENSVAARVRMGNAISSASPTVPDLFDAAAEGEFRGGADDAGADGGAIEVMQSNDRRGRS